MHTLTIGEDGLLALPGAVAERYGFGPSTPVRLVETRVGVLLVPLGDRPAQDDLASELEQWQAAGTSSWEAFPYEPGEQ